MEETKNLVDERMMARAALAAEPTIKVAAISGSLRKASRTRGLIRCAVELCNESIAGMQIEHVDIEALPFLNTDLEIAGKYPPPVEAFRRKILEADSIFFASPEYNCSLSAPLKNAIDWASRPPNVWADLPAAIVTISSDSEGKQSQSHLRQTGVFLDLHFINKPELFIVGQWPPKKFDSDGNVIDPQTKEQLKQVLLSLQAFTLRLRHDSKI